MTRAGQPRPPRPAPALEREARATRRRRAAEEPLDVRLHAREPFVELEVRNPIHRTSYRVLFPEYPLRDSAICTCADFARRALGTCKHLEAGWSWLQERAELPVPEAGPPGPYPAGELWKEVDRRLEVLERQPPSSIREVEAPGTLLFEEGPGPKQAPDAPEGAPGRAKAARGTPTTTSRERP